jgi:hypothetical protein
MKQREINSSKTNSKKRKKTLLKNVGRCVLWKKLEFPNLHTCKENVGEKYQFGIPKNINKTQ